ncbi:MAG: FAD-dependent oxidoreductase [Pseudomonas sp.]|uniref:FAD-dependent oxidoreductase n=1 Tax=Pseudomonas sp. TaxID=306 RepID=UPI003D0EFFD9
MTKKTVHIVGGGIAGLLAAMELSRAGVQVVVHEAAGEFGGRARTREVDGFLFNRGPHALYCKGAFKRELDRFGIAYSGGRSLSGSRKAIVDGQLHDLPTTLVSILTTSLFGFREKLSYLRVFKAIMGGATGDGSFAHWLDEQGLPPRVHAVVEAVGRLSSYANGSAEVSARAMLEQIRLATGGTLYIDGGWISLVNGLADAARAAGADLRVKSRVSQVLSSDCGPQLVMHGGESITPDAVILAIAPHEAAALAPGVASLTEAAAQVRPVRASTLDLALRRFPSQAHDFALGIDTPDYLSVHSGSARLAPVGGALVHIAKYLPVDDMPATDVVAELEAVADLAMPGWRELEVSRQALRGMPVSNGLPRWDLPRPGVSVADAPGVFLAGDWVGDEGMIADAAAASAIKAARAARLWLVHLVERREPIERGRDVHALQASEAL